MSSLRRETGSWTNTPSPFQDPYSTSLAFSKSSKPAGVTSTLPYGAKLPYSSTISATASSSANNFFSHFFSHSSKDLSNPMKFRLSRSSVSAPPVKKTKGFSHSLYDDPAFSADPQTHPYFVTSHDSTMQRRPNSQFHSPNQPAVSSTPAVSMHRSNKPTQGPHPPPQDNTNISQTELRSPAQSSCSSSVSLASFPTTPPSSVPSSQDSHAPTPSDMPRVLQESKAPKKEKKRSAGFSLLRKSTTGNTSSIPFQPVEKIKPKELSPPPYDAASNRPDNPRHVTAPEIRLPIRPAPPPRPATTAADAAPPPISSRRSGDGRRRVVRELDRIDELDESNPLGVSLHHGGPYEAASRIAKASKLTPGGKSLAQPYAYHFTGASNAYIPQPPVGISLNLSPGQVLPHFQPPSPPDGANNVSPPGYTPHSPEALQNPWSPVSPQSPPSLRPPAQRNTFTTPTNGNQISHFISRDPDKGSEDPSMAIGLAMMQSLGPFKNTSPGIATSISSSPSQLESEADFDPYDPAQLEGPNSQRSTVLHLHSANSKTSEDVHSLDPAVSRRQSYINSQDGRSSAMPIQGGPMRQLMAEPSPVQPPSMIQLDQAQPAFQPDQRTLQRSTSLSPSTSSDLPPNFETVHRNLSQTSIHFRHTPSASQENTSHALQDLQHQQIHREHERERYARSIQQSILTSSSTRTGSKPHQPHYLPKRLVMPAPLQPSTLIGNQQQAHTQFTPSPSPPNHVRFQGSQGTQHPSSRSPSPHLLPPILGNQIPRAQDIPMVPSRKLKKRTSVTGPLPFKGYDGPAVAAVSFSANIGYVKPPPSEPVMGRSKTERNPKRVLSKRRTDL